MDERYLPNDTGIATEENLKPITIVLAEEQSDLRQRLRSLLDSEPDFQVLGDVNNGLDALDMVSSLHPDILIIDLHASNNQEIIKFVNLHYPKTAVILPYKIVGTGTKAHIRNSFVATELAKAIRYESARKNNMSGPGLKYQVPYSSQKDMGYSYDPIETLTAREREIFDLVAHELTSTQIAERLSISRRTVEIHRARILHKLGLRNQHRQLVNYAFERGIISK
jgi:DNA-binding NarL/FixJ family response regulator